MSDACRCHPDALVPCTVCAAHGYTIPAWSYNQRAIRTARWTAACLKTDAELERTVYAFTEDHPDRVVPPCHCGADECLAPGVYICALHGKAAERAFEQGEESR